MGSLVTSCQSPAVEVDFEQCSAQVQLLCGNTEYRDQVERLWRDIADDPGPRLLKSRGYGYLVTLFYAVQARSKEMNKPRSSEFEDLTTLVRYVGPRPHKAHSLHRLDNNKGYVLGNVEWADKRKQAEFRRTAQHHQYMGRRMTDRELAELLQKKTGLKVSQAAIKKSRQRLMKKGVAPSDVTRHLFERYKVPYESTKDPVEAWDFPEEFAPKLSYAYQYFRRSGQTRIEFFIEWLKKEINKFKRLAGDPFVERASELDAAANAYGRVLEQTLRDWHSRRQHGVDAVLAGVITPALEPPTNNNPPVKTPSSFTPYVVKPFKKEAPYLPPPEELLCTFARTNKALKAALFGKPPSGSLFARPPVQCEVLNWTITGTDWQKARDASRFSRLANRPSGAKTLPALSGHHGTRLPRWIDPMR